MLAPVVGQLVAGDPIQPGRGRAALGPEALRATIAAANVSAKSQVGRCLGVAHTPREIAQHVLGVAAVEERELL